MASSSVVQREKPLNTIPSQPLNNDGVSKEQRQLLSSHNEGQVEEVELEQDLQQEEEVDQHKQATTSEATIVIVKPFDHPSTFGKDVPRHILGEIIESFIVKRAQEHSQIPLCKLMEKVI